MALTTLAKVRAWVGLDTADTARDAEITRCITAIGTMLPRISNRLLEQTASIVRYFDGARLSGSCKSLWLPSAHRPVVHTGQTLITVQEDGLTLVVAAAGYSATANVLVAGTNEDRQCELIRNGSAWSSGYQNIKVTYTAGPTTVEADVEQLANELVWLMVTEPLRFAKASDSKNGVAYSFAKELTPSSRMLFDSLRVTL